MRARCLMVQGPADLGHPDLLVLPGSKTTVADLDRLGRTGLAALVREHLDPGLLRGLVGLGERR